MKFEVAHIKRAVTESRKANGRRFGFVGQSNIELELRKSDELFRYVYRENSAARQTIRVPIAIWDETKATLDLVSATRKEYDQARRDGLPLLPASSTSTTGPAAKGLRGERLAPTIKELVPLYIADLEESLRLRNATVTTRRNAAKQWANSPDGARRIAGYTTSDAKQFITTMVREVQARGKQGPPTGLKLKGMMSDFFRWALEHNHADNNPMIQTKGLVSYDVEKEIVEVSEVQKLLLVLADFENRYLSKDEHSINSILKKFGYRSLGRNAHALGAGVNFTKLLLLTGARIGQIRNLKIKDCGRDERSIIFQSANSKTKKTLKVGISHLASSVINRQIALLEENGFPTTKDAYLFPAGAIRRQTTCRSSENENDPCSYSAAAQWLEYISLEAEVETHPHFLRKIHATFTGSLGINPYIKRRLTCHAFGGGAHEGYDSHDYTPETREAASRYASYLELLATELQKDSATRLADPTPDFVHSFLFWESETGLDLLESINADVEVAAFTAAHTRKERRKKVGLTQGLRDAERLAEALDNQSPSSETDTEESKICDEAEPPPF